MAASPDCTAWSQLTNIQRLGATATNVTNAACLESRLAQTNVLLDLCDMVIALRPRIFWFENPKSSAKGIYGGMEKALGDANFEVNYCKYSAGDDVFDSPKPTHLWTNGRLAPKMCKKDNRCALFTTKHPGNVCSNSTLATRHRIPLLLCKDLLEMEAMEPAEDTAASSFWPAASICSPLAF